MKQILVYGDSLTWGIVPNTRQRLPHAERWAGVMERVLLDAGQPVRVLEDALNGRRTVWDDPFKPGRNGLVGLEQRIECHSPLALVVLMLGTNDFQATHDNNAWLSGQGVAALVHAIRRAPIEPGMPVPAILIIAPPPAQPARGDMAGKFAGAHERCNGIASAYQQVAAGLGCAFFDAGGVVEVSAADGVHLDQQGHERLGRALAPVVQRLIAT